VTFDKTSSENNANQEVKENNENNDSFQAAKAQIEAELFSKTKIDFKTDLHLFSSISPAKTNVQANLDAKNSLSLPANRVLKPSFKLSFLEEKTKEILDIGNESSKKIESEIHLDLVIQEAHNYSNNITMEECNEESNLSKLDRETTIKEARKLEIESETYNAKLNFKANLSFFNSVTPSRLDTKQEKNLDFKNSRSLPFNRFEKPDIESKNEETKQDEMADQVSDQVIDQKQNKSETSEIEALEAPNDILIEENQTDQIISEIIDQEQSIPVETNNIKAIEQNKTITEDPIIMEDTESEELPDLIVQNLESHENLVEDSNDCTSNKTVIHDNLNDVTLKCTKQNDDENNLNDEDSEESAVINKKEDLNESLESRSSVVIEGTVDQNTVESEVSINNKEDDSSNASFDLNMSSISANNSPSKVTFNLNTATSFIPSNEDNVKSLSRNSSASSLFSSVSQQYERNESSQESKTSSKRVARKKIQPSARNKESQRLMDDNELSVKKANEEAIESGPGRATLRRRKSDLSSTSSTSSSYTANIEAVAKLKANLQQIPSKFGSNDQEVRVTRSKLRALIEPIDEIIIQDKPGKATVSRTRSSKATTSKQLEKLQENEEAQTEMSISNLKKHDEVFEKMDVIASLTKQNSTETEENELITIKTNSRSKALRGRSPSPTASSCVSESTITSTIASATTKSRSTRGKSKTTKQQEAPIEEHDSPTSSVVSIASTTASSRYSMRERRNEANETTKLSPSKHKKTKSSKSEEAEGPPDVAKVKRTRSKLKNNETIESAKLGVINEGVITLDDSEDDTANSQDVIVEEKPKSVIAKVKRTRSKLKNSETSESIKSEINIESENDTANSQDTLEEKPKSSTLVRRASASDEQQKRSK
jgi:hypothetical protein